MADNSLLALMIRRVAERTFSNSALLKIIKGYPRMRVCVHGSNNCLGLLRHVSITILISANAGGKLSFLIYATATHITR